MSVALLPILDRLLVRLLKSHAYLVAFESMSKPQQTAIVSQSATHDPLTVREQEIFEYAYAVKGGEQEVTELYKGLYKTAMMSAGDLTNGGIVYLLGNYLLRVVYLIPLLLLWRNLMVDGVEAGMSLSQMLTYTYLGAMFSDILIVRSPASGWLYEGLLISLYQRPLGILQHLVAHTIGRWLPTLVLFSFPMVLLAPLFGVSLQIRSFWALPSLALCVSLGFAVDSMFACLTIRLHNASWLVYTIRNAITVFFAGQVIPFAMLPWGLGHWLQYLPLGSLAGAPLAIYTGLAEAGPIITFQLLWNVLLWPAAIIIWRKSQEGMVSFGG